MNQSQSTPTSGSTPEFKEAIMASYRAVESAIEARDAKAWFDAMYSENIVVVGDGGTVAVRGREALMPGVEGIIQAVHSCRIEVDSAMQASGDQGYSFATYSCQQADAAAPDFKVRALFVWQREQTGWKVVAEMYQMGSM